LRTHGAQEHGARVAGGHGESWGAESCGARRGVSSDRYPRVRLSLGLGFGRHGARRATGRGARIVQYTNGRPEKARVCSLRDQRVKLPGLRPSTIAPHARASNSTAVERASDTGTVSKPAMAPVYDASAACPRVSSASTAARRTSESGCESKPTMQGHTTKDCDVLRFVCCGRWVFRGLCVVCGLV